MKFPFPPKLFLRLSLTGALALAVTGVALACGPDFPNSYLKESDKELLSLPGGRFADEVARLLKDNPPTLPPWKVVQAPRGFGWEAEGKAQRDARNATLQAETADLRAALTVRGDPPVQINTLVDGYANYRMSLEGWKTKRAETLQVFKNQTEYIAEAAKLQSQGVNVLNQPPKLEPPPTLPVLNLPMEFVHYLNGVVAWDQDRKDDARTIWADLLAMPETERHYRSTWAAYMLARAWAEETERLSDEYPESKADEAATKAATYARLTRSLAGQGFSDPLGLAAASYGWEAKAALVKKDYLAAINLYFIQQAMGDATSIESLRTVAHRIAGQAIPEQLLSLAKDPVGRAVVTAYLKSYGHSVYISPDEPADDETAMAAGHWATALDKAGVSNVPDAERFAWVAYEGGQFALAKQWADLAPSDSSLAEWVRAQLTLRGGNLVEGEKHLRKAVAAPGLSPGQQKLVYAELGRTCLAEDNYSGALAAFIAGGHDEDASYVAERVMKLDDLTAFVETNLMGKTRANDPVTGSPADNLGASDMGGTIRWVLAKRLARSEKPEEAEKYFPDDMRAKYHAYLADIRLGFDVSQKTDDRAAALWRAAQTTRNDGMTLLATQLEPDWGMWGGGYSWLGSDGQFRLDAAKTGVGDIFGPTPLEVARLGEIKIPTEHLHYRYRAADLAWWAASLMPNDSEDTAKVLNEAGGWIKASDPLAADKFYKALVIRCGNTELGKAAAKAHWFPVVKQKA